MRPNRGIYAFCRDTHAVKAKTEILRLRARPDPQNKRVGKRGGRCAQDDTSRVMNNPGVRDAMNWRGTSVTRNFTASLWDAPTLSVLDPGFRPGKPGLHPGLSSPRAYGTRAFGARPRAPILSC